MQSTIKILALLLVLTACRSTVETDAETARGARGASEPAQRDAAKTIEVVAAAPIVPAKPASNAGGEPKGAPPRVIAAVPLIPLGTRAGDGKGGLVAATPVIPGAKVASTPSSASGTRAERFEAIQKEHDEAMEAYFAPFRAAKSAEEAEELAKAVQRPDVHVCFERAQALLDEQATDATAFDVLEWMVGHAPQEFDRSMLYASIERDHFDRVEIARILPYLGRGEQPERDLIRRLSVSSPHTEVRGQALYALAEGVQQDSALAREMRELPPEKLAAEYEQYIGAGRVKQLLAADPADLEREAEASYERVQREYGNVVLNAGKPRETTLGKKAASSLFEIRNLSVGKVAPEIEGEDVAGVPFKLSDYRGKVVLLDFWGFW